jgi:hypothetical protein
MSELVNCFARRRFTDPCHRGRRDGFDKPRNRFDHPIRDVPSVTLSRDCRHADPSTNKSRMA